MTTHPMTFSNCYYSIFFAENDVGRNLIGFSLKYLSNLLFLTTSATTPLMDKNLNVWKEPFGTFLLIDVLTLSSGHHYDFKSGVFPVRFFKLLGRFSLIELNRS